MNGQAGNKSKQSLYFPETMLQELRDEAARLDRSLSWVMQRAFKIARAQIAAIPSTPLTEPEDLGLEDK